MPTNQPYFSPVENLYMNHLVYKFKLIQEEKFIYVKQGRHKATLEFVVENNYIRGSMV